MDIPVQRQSADAPTNFSINCTDIPGSLFDEDAAIEHFGKFGTVIQINLQPRKRSCIVEYEKREAAERAVLNAGAYDGFMFEVKLNKKKRFSKAEDDPDWLPDPEVAAELAAMLRDNPPQSRRNRQQNMHVVAIPPVDSRKINMRKTLVKTLERKKTRNVPKSTSTSHRTPVIPLNSLDEEEIVQLLNKPWPTIEDKLTALEIRDRLLRAHLRKRHGALKGCCPDMCPERERLLRQSQRQIASFESTSMDSDQHISDAKRAVKQYSRSSADQEEPLAHELRPESVLNRTLLYLLHYIMDLCDKPELSVADWFHFMWDRLRAIRKDIAQQALCCQGSLSLVEACARFHAHCAARLIEEPPSTFDQRLNTENLLKCLQTLKYMYNDLRNRGEAEACVNEPEFRAYVILLNMCDSNFMWEVQQLAPEVQSSPEVCFAIKIFTALDNNNYVRFFKLVRQTTYLNACILLRYFNDVRARALQRLIKAYCLRGASYFPANELMESLAFETLDSMEYFLHLHGIQMGFDDRNINCVILDRNTYRNTAVSYAQERAFNLIEKKIECSLGELIYGSKLPPSDYENYLPHSSFDKNNYFKKTSLLAEDQGNVPPPELIQDVNKIMESPNTFKKVADDSTKKISLLNPENKFTFSEPNKAKNIFQQYVTETAIKPPTSLAVDSHIKNSSFNYNSEYKTIEEKRAPFGMTKTDNSFIFSKPALPITSNHVPSTNIFSTSVFSKPFNDINEAPNDNIFSSSKFSNSIFASVKPEENHTPISIFKPQTQSIFGGNTSEENNIFTKNDTFKNNSFNVFGNSSKIAPTYSNEKKILEEQEKARLIEEEKKQRLEEERLEKINKEKLRQQELQKAIEKEKKALELAQQKAELEAREKEKKKKEFDEIVENCTQKVAPEIIEDVVKDLCVTVMEEEIKKYDAIVDLSLDIRSELIEEVCKEECKEAVHIAKRLVEIRQCMLAKKTLQRWKALVMKSRRRRMLLMNTPSWLSSINPPLALPKQTQVLQRMRDFHRGKLYDLKIPEDQKIDEIDVFAQVKKNLLRKSQDNDKTSFSSSIFWKITIFIPYEKESMKYNRFFQTWLRGTFANQHLTTNEDHIVSLTDVYWFKKYHLSICKVMNTECESVYEKATMGAHGYLFYGKVDEDVSLLRKIDDVILSKCEYAIFPVALILAPVEEKLMTCIKEKLNHFKENKLISAFKIFHIADLSNRLLSTNTTEALKWLSKYYPVKPTIEIDYLKTFLDECIGKELWYRFKLGLQSPIREAFDKPESVINLYNEAVDKTILIASDNDLKKYPVFAEEFKQYLYDSEIYPKDYEYFPSNWKNNMKYLKSTLESFKITQYTAEWPPVDWESFQLSIKSFIYKIGWYKDVEKVFLKILRIFIGNEASNENCNRSDFEFDETSWLSIMNVLVSEKIDGVYDIIKDHVNKDKSLNVMKVVYKKKDLYNYRTTPWWYRSPHIKSINSRMEDIDINFLDDTLDELGISCPKRAKIDSSMETIPDEEWLSSVIKNFDQSIQETNTCNKMLMDLEKTIEAECTRQAQIETFLNSIISNK